MSKLQIILIALLLSTTYTGATTCHDLQQSQLLSLNERMNQMIDTISALFPTRLKKSASSVPPTLPPSIDYTTSSPGYESSYYTSPPAYMSPTPYIMYQSSPYAPTPMTVDIAPPMQPNLIPVPPCHFPPIERHFTLGHAFPSVSNSASQPSRPQYQYQRYPLTPYANPIPIAHSPLHSYLPVPYSFIKSSANYNHPYAPEYLHPTSLGPNIPSNPPGYTPFPLPVYLPPTFAPAYQNQPEFLPTQYP